MRNTISGKNKQLIVQMYLEKKTIREISEVSKISRQSIYNILTKNGITPNRTLQPLDEDIIEKALHYYTVDGYPANKIADILEVHAKRLTAEFKQRKAKRATIKTTVKEEVLKKYDENVLTIKEISVETKLAPTSIIKLVTTRKLENPNSFVRRPSAFKICEDENPAVL